MAKTVGRQDEDGASREREAARPSGSKEGLGTIPAKQVDWRGGPPLDAALWPQGMSLWPQSISTERSPYYQHVTLESIG